MPPINGQQILGKSKTEYNKHFSYKWDDCNDGTLTDLNTGDVYYAQ